MINFDIVGKRKYYFAVSIIILLIGFISFIVNGFELDIQFQGGTLIQVEMNDDKFDAEAIGQSVSNTIGKSVSAQKMQPYNVGEENKVVNMLMLKVSSSETLTDAEIDKVFAVLRSDFGVKPDAESQIQSVQPFIGKEMLSNAILAAVIASILIMIYVWWRFRVMSLSAAVVALITLAHDCLVMFAVYSIFRLPLNESFVAAILTILGYSINDTIVLYDRIRENTRLMRKTPFPELVNKSILQTLTRSINTMLTTLISILVVFIFASIYNIDSLKEFSFPLIIGMIAGAYSTIFIACPLWLTWKTSREKKVIAPKRA